MQDLDSVGAKKIAGAVAGFHPVAILCNLMSACIITALLYAVLFNGKSYISLLLIAVCLLTRWGVVRLLRMYLARKFLKG